jgi:hypothetical protein
MPNYSRKQGMLKKILTFWGDRRKRLLTKEEHIALRNLHEFRTAQKQRLAKAKILPLYKEQSK